VEPSSGLALQKRRNERLPSGSLSRPGRGTASRGWLAPGAIVLFAIALRLVAVGADSGYKPANDAFEYSYLARSIAAGDGYPETGYLLQGGPTAVRGPGYPYLLGGVYALTGDSLTAGRLLGVALGAFSVLLLYLIAKRIWGRRIGLIAAALAAVFPPLVLLSRDLVSENLFIALELAAALCVLNFRRSGGAWRWAAMAGALCGLAALTRNTGLALAIPIVLAVWTQRPRWTGSALAPPLLALACGIVVVTPWIVRDAAEFGRFVPVTTSSGIASAGTYNEASYRDSSTHGAWRDPQIVPEFSRLFVTSGRDEAAVDSTLRRDAREFAWRHPGYVIETSAWNLLRLFELSDGSVVDERGRVVNDRGIGSADPVGERIGIALAAVFALVGIFAILRARSRSRSEGGPPGIPSGPLFLWLIPILMIIVAIPIAGLPRYRLPADPFLLILAAIGLTVLWDRGIKLRGSTG
jgi:4-amino-4-deoxy-L-arabinose transferase-like glycosyltransferase